VSGRRAGSRRARGRGATGERWRGERRTGERRSRGWWSCERLERLVQPGAHGGRDHQRGGERSRELAATWGRGPPQLGRCPLLQGTLTRNARAEKPRHLKPTLGPACPEPRPPDQDLPCLRRQRCHATSKARHEKAQISRPGGGGGVLWRRRQVMLLARGSATRAGQPGVVSGACARGGAGCCRRACAR
jgi:hypothetical protein